MLKLMPRYFLISEIILAFINQVGAQTSQTERDSIAKLSHADHQLMLQKLGIESLRPGPSGNPSAPNAANSDESKAKQYKEVPDPLVFENGSSVQSLEDWERRKKGALRFIRLGNVRENSSQLTKGKLDNCGGEG